MHNLLAYIASRPDVLEHFATMATNLIQASINEVSLQKITYKVVVLIWRLLITAIICRIIRHFTNRQNYPLKCVIFKCRNYPS